MFVKQCIYFNIKKQSVCRKANFIALTHALNMFTLLLMRYASKRTFMSSSTEVIPEIPKLFTSTFTMFGERNAGNVGPK